MSEKFDFVVIGGGIIGLAVAYRLSSTFSDCTVALLEKETVPAFHQSGRNSGVLHSGIYYKTGSLKATTCRAGKKMMEDFCTEQGIDFELCGKVVVARSVDQLDQLDKILARGKANGIACESIDEKQLVDMEPCVSGVGAVWVPEAGIINYRKVCERIAEVIESRGVLLKYNWEVKRLTFTPSQVCLSNGVSEVVAKYAINCSGLHSDRLVKLSGVIPPARIIPFRGEYYKLKPEKQFVCRNLIYPVPDLNFPFLGVHFTRMIDGGVECGPNAVLALAKEGYTWETVNIADLVATVTAPGFRKFVTQHWRMGLGEMVRSLSKQAFCNALNHLVPQVKPSDLVPARSGVRAQALGKDGKLLDDFLFLYSERLLHVCNAPSPAATASLKIAEQIVENLVSQM